MNGRPHPVRLIALGAADRGDDGAGLIAADLLPPRVRDRCELHRASGLDVLDLVDLAPGRACVIADAARGLEPGRVIVLPFAHVLRPAAATPAPRSSHELPVGELIRLTAELRGGVPPGCFVLIGGGRFGLGEGISPAVEAALPAFVRKLAAAIREWDRCVSRPQAA